MYFPSFGSSPKLHKIFLPSSILIALKTSLKLISLTKSLLYSRAIFGNECASESVIKFLFESSLISSAIYVSALNPSSIANILSYFSLKIFSILSVQFP